MLIEIHMLKNYPPVNLNRDDTGAPKTCFFGGVTRGRVSSQCLKRSWRTSELLKSELEQDQLGIRTRKLPSLVGKKLLDMGVPQDYVEGVVPVLCDLGKSEKKEKKQLNKEESNKKSEKSDITKQMGFYSHQDIETVIQVVKASLDMCKSVNDVKNLKVTDIQKALEKSKETRPITLDIALFGRMVTSDAFRSVEASMQVAHAISTNKVAVESDYFTAMDDLLSGETVKESGAGMIEDTDYTASCYYHYASLDTDALAENLKDIPGAQGLVKRVVPVLLRVMVFTNPSGKQNSFAGHILPSAILVECKEVKIPTSLVNAFVKPVSGTDLVEESMKKLAAEADMTARNFGLPVKERLWFRVDKYNCQPESATKVCATLGELVDAVSGTLD